MNIREDPFIAIVGAPRSGNSLCGDILNAVGYNFGPDEAVAKSDDKRLPRWFHKHYSNHDFSRPGKLPNLLEHLEKQDINALQLMAYYKVMLPIMQEEMKGLKVIVCTRKLWPAIKSHINLVLNLTDNNYTNKWTKLTKAWAAAWSVIKRWYWSQQVLTDGRYDAFELPFEKVLEYDVLTLVKFSAYLGCPSASADFVGVECIDPNVSEFS